MSGAAKLPSVQIHALDSSSGAIDPWRCCDCSTLSMGYEVSSMKGGPHFSES